jgi:glycosyltransferase involved in cell wall biosynthesis
MRWLVCALADRFPEKLERCIQSVDSQEIPVEKVVICNTMNADFVPLARAVAEKYNWNFVVTESNGTPGKGKNSALDYFAESGCDYMSCIDGDDFLEPSGLQPLYDIIKEHSPDVVGLVGSYAIYGDTKIPLVQWEKSRDNHRKTFGVMKPENVRRFHIFANQIREKFFHNRFLVYSRKALKYLRFTEDMLGLEDMLLAMKLKHYHLSGEINYIVLNSPNVYVYDVNQLGTFKNFLVYEDMQWHIEYFWNELNKIPDLNLDGIVPVIDDD